MGANQTARIDGAGTWLSGGPHALWVGAGAWGRPHTLVPVEGAPIRVEDRIELPGDGLSTWWKASAAGLEQGWTVDRSPDGTGPLVIDVPTDAPARVSPAQVSLPGWTVSGLVATDADGVALTARFLPSQAGFRVAVDDRGARYPLHIDPLYTTVSATISGSSSFGAAMANAGDVNSDGYEDLVVGTPGDGDPGEATVYLGSASGIDTTGSALIADVGDFGISVDGAGDVNGDGYDDVVAGAYTYSGSTGRAYLYLGSASGVDTTAASTLTGSAGTFFGFPVLGAGDVDGDGYADVAVGAYGYAGNTGEVMVYLGSDAGLSSSAATTLVGDAPSDYFGTSLAAGDFDADGYSDLVVGAYGSDDFVGHIYVYPGSSAGTDTTPSLSLAGVGSYDYFGDAIATGDVNGDGYDDAVISATQSDADGRIDVYLGSSAGLSSTPTTSVTEGVVGRYGDALALVDIDGDGYDEVVVGAPQTPTRSSGAVYVYAGSPDGTEDTASQTFTGDRYDKLGYALAGLDLDGDGYGDLAISALGLFEVQIYMGYVDSDGDGYPASEDCDDTNASIYPGAQEVCDSANADEDCDGLADDDDPSVIGKSTFYVDTDGDGYGTTASITACDLSTGYAEVSGDCDDGDAGANPGAAEVCDDADTDEDCDGLADDDDPSATGQTRWYIDYDGDGYGTDRYTTTACDAAGYVSNADDCDDASADIYPGADETVADGVDQDCDGVDACYQDEDGDGYGTSAMIAGSSLSCDGGGGSPVSTDCDDSAATTWPGAPETVADGVDQDCDGVDACYQDEDGDGYGTTAVIAGSSLSCADGTGAGNSTDCDDTVAAIHPDAVEFCDSAGADEDCNGLADDDDPDVTGTSTWYIDYDGDGYGSDRYTAQACQAPSGYVGDDSDCDDASATSYPGAAEVPGDGIDQDCDGADQPADSGADTGDTAGSDTDSGSDDSGSDDSGSDDTGNRDTDGLVADTGPKETGGGCSCAAGSGSGRSALLVVLGALLAARRRRA